MSQSTVSVIIPVYNVQQYLNECIQSVVVQTYRDLQIVLVDDGSTDNSGELCDEWAKKDTRIRVIHKANRGLSDARNVGIQHATGGYILFLDSDDYWGDAEAVSRLMVRAALTDADVVNFSCKKVTEETGEAESYFKNAVSMPMELSKKEQLTFLADGGLYIASACNKLIKRTLFDDELFFRKGVYSEDIEWCAKLLIKAQTIDFVPEEFYCYRQRQGSIRHLYSDKKCTDLADNILRCFDMANEVDPQTKEAFWRYTAYQFATFFMVQALAEHPQKAAVRKLKQYKWVLSHHGGNQKVRVLHWCCRLIGYTNTCRLLRLVYAGKR